MSAAEAMPRLQARAETTFYERTLAKLLDEELLDRTASTLVVGGGDLDRRTLQRLGFDDVCISNLDERQTPERFAPYAWTHQDAEALTYPDGAFDQVLVHAALHHCHSPHRALLEMYRVAARCIVAFEARDSLTMRLACALGLGRDYEVEAVVGNGLRYGGVRNTAIPNYVYRWTEREVEKTLASYAPTGRPSVRYFYGLRLPTQRWRMHRSPLYRLAGGALGLALGLACRLAPSQGNEFAFWVGKELELWPWLRRDGDAVAIDPAWARARFPGAAR